MENNQVKPWKCKHGHVLGQVERVEVQGNGRTWFVHRLILYRQAVDMAVEQPIDVDVIAELEGTVLDVRCSVQGCGAMRTWMAGEAAMERMLEMMGGKT